MMTQSHSSFEIVPGNPASGIVLLCDHARNTVPDDYNGLGLPAKALERHIAYDIGAEALTRGLAERLGVPAVHSCFSRLLIDPNRGEDDPTVVMKISDGAIVSGNHPISKEDTARRFRDFYHPYHQAVASVVDESVASGVNPIIFSIHSFTPAWKDVPRPWEVALLWDADPRLPQFLIEGLRMDESLTVGDNEPYDGALRNDTMYKHATSRGLAQGLLEVRQDLISNANGVAHWVDRLAPLLEQANQRSDMHEIRHYGSRTDGTAQNGDYS